MSDFASLGLTQPLVDAIGKLGFVTPTAIQEQAIPILLEDEADMIGLAQTGTGKTAAFGLPLIDLVDEKEKYTQALVLAPTRELCLQIAKELEQFGRHIRALKILAVYGGTDIYQQIKTLRKGVQIVVATPGRLRDLIKRKAINIEEIEYVVLDEADEMLNMGFKEEIDEILENTPDDKLTWLFSATMPREVRRISSNYMSDPVEIKVGHANSSNQDIDHQYVTVYPSDRYEVLRRFLDFNESCFGLVFTRTRRDAREVADMLGRDGYRADALHGDLTQAQRDRVMARFRDRRLQILVATDVAARGIDVNDITHVFHYNIPEDISFYTHRSGRTGRAGNKGISLVLAHPRDVSILRRLERTIKVKFSSVQIPTGPEICEQRLLKHVDSIKEAEINEQVAELLPKLIEQLGEELTKEELIAKVATISFARFLKTYSKARDLNMRESRDGGGRGRGRDGGGRGRGRDGGGGRGRDGYAAGNGRRARRQRLFINIGSMDVGGKGPFINMICKEARISGESIGRIDMQEKFTFFEVEENAAEQVISELKDADFEGRTLRVNAGDRFERKGGGSGGGGNRRRRHHRRN
ncbi:MAG: DEAD/DEAH box helicase [Saprospiraceae bacterium]